MIYYMFGQDVVLQVLRVKDNAVNVLGDLHGVRTPSHWQKFLLMLICVIAVVCLVPSWRTRWLPGPGGERTERTPVQNSADNELHGQAVPSTPLLSTKHLTNAELWTSHIALLGEYICLAPVLYLGQMTRSRSSPMPQKTWPAFTSADCYMAQSLPERFSLTTTEPSSVVSYLMIFNVYSTRTPSHCAQILHS